MLQKIAEFARATGQPAPESPGQFVRCCLESLALAYREKLSTLESILDRRFDVIHIVGGGGKNALLSQMTADATGRRVVVGPYEATAIGNALVQAMAVGQVRDLAHLRRIVASLRAGSLAVYEPSDSGRGWDADLRAQFTRLVNCRKRLVMVDRLVATRLGNNREFAGDCVARLAATRFFSSQSDSPGG